MRKKFCFFAELISPALALCPVLPALYMTSDGRLDEMMIGMYLASFVILLPMAVVRYASKRVRHFPSYAGICLLSLAMAGILAWAAGRFLPWERAARAAAAASEAFKAASDNSVYQGAGEGKALAEVIALPVFIASAVIESGLVMYTMFQVRMNESRRLRAVRENDLNWKSGVFLYEKPVIVHLIWFAVLYIASLLFACPVMSNIAAGSFLVYAVIYGLYRHLDETEGYLKRLSYVVNMPEKRIRTIGTGILLILLAVMAAAGAVSGLSTRRLRHYADVRRWESSYKVPEFEIPEPEEPMLGAEYFGDITGEPVVYEEWKYAWLTDLIAQILLIAVIGFAIFMMYKNLRRVFDEFRDRDEENGDTAVTLENGDVSERIFRRRRRSVPDTPAERVRREYRRTIRKARKDIPGAYETPEEIEREAGLFGTEAMRDLHERYEEARYRS